MVVSRAAVAAAMGRGLGMDGNYDWDANGQRRSFRVIVPGSGHVVHSVLRIWRCMSWTHGQRDTSSDRMANLLNAAASRIRDYSALDLQTVHAPRMGWRISTASMGETGEIDIERSHLRPRRRSNSIAAGFQSIFPRVGYGDAVRRGTRDDRSSFAFSVNRFMQVGNGGVSTASCRRNRKGGPRGKGPTHRYGDHIRKTARDTSAIGLADKERFSPPNPISSAGHARAFEASDTSGSRRQVERYHDHSGSATTMCGAQGGSLVEPPGVMSAAWWRGLHITATRALADLMLVRFGSTQSHYTPHGNHASLFRIRISGRLVSGARRPLSARPY